MTKDSCNARAEFFAQLAAELYVEADTARRARYYGDAAHLEGRANRAKVAAAAFRREAQARRA